MGKKYTLEYENSPLGGILHRQLFLATDEWKNKLATIKDVETAIGAAGGALIEVTWQELKDKRDAS